MTRPDGKINATAAAMRSGVPPAASARSAHGMSAPETSRTDAAAGRAAPRAGDPGPVATLGEEAADAAREQQGEQDDREAVGRMAEEEAQPLQQRDLHEHEAESDRREEHEERATIPAGPPAASSASAGGAGRRTSGRRRWQGARPGSRDPSGAGAYSPLQAAGFHMSENLTIWKKNGESSVGGVDVHGKAAREAFEVLPGGDPLEHRVLGRPWREDQARTPCSARPPPGGRRRRARGDSGPRAACRPGCAHADRPMARSRSPGDRGDGSRRGPAEPSPPGRPGDGTRAARRACTSARR